MKVGFYLKEVNFRGIANSIYTFAKNNEKILKNKSVIFYNSKSVENQIEAIRLFKKKFTVYKTHNFNELEKYYKKFNLDIIYFQREGFKDYLVKNTKNVIHAIFPENMFGYHGFKYAYISKWLSKVSSNKKYPYVPLPVELVDNKLNLRNKLNIPLNAKVIGYHGGNSSFDLQFVRDLIEELVNKNNNIYFIFMNINKFISHHKVIFLRGTFNPLKKVKFINTCDAMLHARSLGESFGISCAEFAIKNKLIFTYGFCRHRAHMDICANNIVPYFSYYDLKKKLIRFKKEERVRNGIKKKFTEKKTIKIFEKVFLKSNYNPPKIKINDFIFVNIMMLTRNYFYVRHKIYTTWYKYISKPLRNIS